MSQNSLHVGQHAGAHERGEGVRDDVTAEQNGVPHGQLSAGVPFTLYEEGSRQLRGTFRISDSVP